MELHRGPAACARCRPATTRRGPRPRARFSGDVRAPGGLQHPASTRTTRPRQPRACSWGVLSAQGVLQHSLSREPPPQRPIRSTAPLDLAAAVPTPQAPPSASASLSRHWRVCRGADAAGPLSARGPVGCSWELLAPRGSCGTSPARGTPPEEPARGTTHPSRRAAHAAAVQRPPTRNGRGPLPPQRKGPSNQVVLSSAWRSDPRSTRTAARPRWTGWRRRRWRSASSRSTPGPGR